MRKNGIMRKNSIMRRRRRHYQFGGGYYNTGGAGAQSLAGIGSVGGGSNFAKGFIAGYQSCVPGVHWQGYTHPI